MDKDTVRIILEYWQYCIFNTSVSCLQLVFSAVSHSRMRIRDGTLGTISHRIKQSHPVLFDNGPGS